MGKPFSNGFIETSEQLIPILALEDVQSGISLLKRVFGFELKGSGDSFGAMMALGNQNVLIVPKVSIFGSAKPHHVALSVPDTDAAMNLCLSRGGALAKSMTPDGPLEIPEFWGGGVRYVFFEGPEGALIELCMKKGEPSPSEWGHDHIGVQCDDFKRTNERFEQAGCMPLARYALHRQDGITNVAFLKRGASIAELFCPPKPVKVAAPQPQSGWVGCLSL